MLRYTIIALALFGSTMAQSEVGTSAPVTATINNSDGGDFPSSICTPNGFDSCSTTPFTSTTFTSFVSPTSIATSESTPSATATQTTESSSFTSSFPSSSASSQNSTSDAVSTFSNNITTSLVTTTDFGFATGSVVLSNISTTAFETGNTTSTTRPSANHHSSTALIAGLTIGLIVLLVFALLGTLFLCVRSKRRKERRKTEIRSRAWTAVHAPSQAAPSTYAEDDDRSLYQNASSESCYSEPSAMTSEDPFLSSPIGSSTAPSPTTETMSHNNSPVTIREVWHHDGGPVRLIEHPPAYQTLSMVDRARHPASIYPAMVRAQKEGQGRLRIVT